MDIKNQEIVCSVIHMSCNPSHHNARSASSVNLLWGWFIWVVYKHLLDKVLEHIVNVPIALGWSFVKWYLPQRNQALYRASCHLSFVDEVELCPDNNDRNTLQRNWSHTFSRNPWHSRCPSPSLDVCADEYYPALLNLLLVRGCSDIDKVIKNNFDVHT